jgi:hypothetical protein
MRDQLHGGAAGNLMIVYAQAIARSIAEMRRRGQAAAPEAAGGARALAGGRPQRGRLQEADDDAAGIVEAEESDDDDMSTDIDSHEDANTSQNIPSVAGGSATSFFASPNLDDDHDFGIIGDDMESIIDDLRQEDGQMLSRESSDTAGGRISDSSGGSDNLEGLDVFVDGTEAADIPTYTMATFSPEAHGHHYRSDQGGSGSGGGGGGPALMVAEAQAPKRTATAVSATTDGGIQPANKRNRGRPPNPSKEPPNP